MLFPAPRYGAEAIVKLIEQVDGDIIITPASPLPVTHEILQKRSMKTYQIPPLEELLQAQTARYPFTKTFKDHKHEPLLSLHTSGTTGFPKPILWTHDWADSVLRGIKLTSPTPEYVTSAHYSYPGARIMYPFMAFHASGAMGMVLMPFCTGSVVVWPPPTINPATAMEAIADALDFLGDEGKVYMLMLPPPHIEYLAANPLLLDRVSSKVQSVSYAGGDISTAAGNTIHNKLRLATRLASTELGSWPSLRRLKAGKEEGVQDEWHWLRLHPAANVHLDIISDSAEGPVGEAVMVRNSDDGWVQPIFKMYPQDTERRLGDLFVTHPMHADLWKYVGRADERLDFTTAQMFHPHSTEKRILENPAVVEVMMVGTRRPRAALIIRLKEGKGLDDVWGTVEEVNKDAPVDARVGRDMVLLVEEPFLLTGKGSVQKKGMLEKYEREIEGLYERSGKEAWEINGSTH
jgi:acyl-coenzyme A synthetase/AMP-(fatty) acid ligase